jgi:hypothetical protein
MKSKKNILIIVLAVLVIARIVIAIIENKKIDHTTIDSNPSTSPEEVHALNPDANLSKAPEEAVTSQNPAVQSDLCQSMRDHYQNLSEVQKMEKTSIRFVNIHKKVDGVVYRTRFFYKDSSESEIPTYLLYKEDQTEEDYLIETSPYKKGPQYLKIEKAPGTIIYTEEGVNIGADQDLFLHYENKVLKDLQGVSPQRPEKDFIECRF